MEYNRVKWASRRGMLELDLVLEPFVLHSYPTLSEAEQERFQALLTCEDQDLFAWFMRSREADDEHKEIVAKVLAFKLSYKG